MSAWVGLSPRHAMCFFALLVTTPLSSSIIFNTVAVSNSKSPCSRDSSLLTNAHHTRKRQGLSDAAHIKEMPTITRRKLMATVLGSVASSTFTKSANAENREAIEQPDIPPGPEERSGLVVLRVAEVAQFQEKILRAVANGDLDYIISPQQIVFGTQILLKNSNLDGNMKLMIYNEIPENKRDDAIVNAVEALNTLQSIILTAADVQRPFEKKELISMADMYRTVRLELNDMYEYLPPKEKAKYYGYFMAVTEYEKKVAEGTYNPDVDGVLRFD
uniref:Uncharacterized protein n=1 Tax=Trieres chinensis TaxID=1514140 RepID=A0A7S1ZSV3_TRICV|mmetsp:Transcript_32038/g.65391  ORF Transcript_32038/g.65391 Transcript_32038/m.65391 type:complete len:274 (+) Transcript_32038:151-972(+)|eukprot:CAMPEP_0183300238 /NCGR_PEP_ID=MMETSP0160_2-20130417/6736_1 /TAXON_ID=2839 ORGANISM="Odontella Sinensis, Strain Grunow 1884" /NCGR_SAMPLE_ID=MMETSP0160_2 /ASSEMBLY_ACC=CAM_ASM_000250 /LENGTH=273 /DNA_ID=CAMNT_0025462625 /DNA_START=123 /DNA_END=944 /DNA_ORIENTATION=+